jgi:hypothetical protein
VILAAQRYGVEHADELHVHRQKRLNQLERMRERLTYLRAEEKRFEQAFGETAAGSAS